MEKTMRTIKIIGLGPFLLLLLCCSSCEKKVSTLPDFSSHINDQDHGFKVCRSVNGVLVSVLYLPPEYLAMKELTTNNTSGKLNYDSLLNFYNNATSFIITFGPDETKKNTNDIMFDNINNLQEYTERSLKLNFEMENNVRLRTKNGEYAPVLSSLENTYGLSKDRKINLVFAGGTDTDLKDSPYYDFVYADETFGVGTLHFNFDKNKIKENMPEVSIN
jgi:hypothetical protein